MDTFTIRWSDFGVICVQDDAATGASASISSACHVGEPAGEETAALSEDACLDEVSAFMGAATFGTL